MITRFISIVYILLNCMACGGNEADPEPGPKPELPVPSPEPKPEPKPGDIVLKFITPLDSVKVETSEEFIFTINRENYDGKFKMKLDTVCPKFEIIVIQDGEAKQIIRKGCNITIDGKELSNTDSLTAGEHVLKFSNPAVVGSYELSLDFIASDSISKNEKIKLKVYSPPVIFKIYEVDPYFDLKIYDKNYFETLNKNYTYQPLSSVFVGKRVDTIYTKEYPNPGYPNSGYTNELGEQYQFNGRGTTVFCFQEGGKDFWFDQGIIFDQNTYTLQYQWDGATTTSLTYLKQGFHAFDFWVTTINGNITRHRFGKTSYTIECYDYWGKKVTTDLTLVALDRNSILPETGHRLPD